MTEAQVPQIRKRVNISQTAKGLQNEAGKQFSKRIKSLMGMRYFQLEGCTVEIRDSKI